MILSLRRLGLAMACIVSLAAARAQAEQDIATTFAFDPIATNATLEAIEPLLSDSEPTDIALRILLTGVIRPLIEELAGGSRGATSDAAKVGRLLFSLGDRLAEKRRADLQIRAQHAGLGLLLLANGPTTEELIVFLGAHGRSFGNLTDRTRRSGAIRIFDAALGLIDAHHPGNAELVSAFLNLKANALAKSEMASEGIPLLERSLAIRRSALGADHIKVAEILNNLALTYQEAGRYLDALRAAEEAVAICARQPEPDSRQAVTAWSTLAQIEIKLGRYDNAIRRTREALNARKRLFGTESADYALGLNDLAAALGTAERWPEAVEAQKESVRIVRAARGEMSEWTASAISNLAGMMEHLDDFPEALRLYERSGRIKRQLFGSQSLEVALHLNNIGVVYDQMGQYEKARDALQDSLDIYQFRLSPDHPAVTTAMSNLGAVLGDLGQSEEGIAMKERALAIRRSSMEEPSIDVGHSLNNIGVTYLALGRPGAALSRFREALAIIDRLPGDGLSRFRATVLTHLSMASRRLGDHPGAVEYGHAAWVLSIEAGSRSRLAHTGNALASAYRSSDHPALAIYHGKQAVAAIQAIRGSLASLDRASQQAFVEQYRAIYERLAGWLIEAERIPEALEVLGMLKEQEFHEFQFPLRGADSAADAADPRRTRITWSGPERPHADTQAALEARMQTTTRELFPLAERARDPLKAQGLTAADQARLAELRQVREAELAEFAAFAGRLTAALGGARPPPATALPDTAQSRRLAEIVAQLARQAGQEVVLLHYVVTAERLYVVLQSAEGSRSLSHPAPAAELLRKIVALRQAIARPSGDPRPAAQALHADLMAPVLPLLAGRTPLLMLALTGPLRYVPFAALHDGERYLVERHALSLLHPAALARVDAPRRPAWQVQGFGLSRAVPGFPALAAVRQELDGIGGLYGPASRFWLDADFTEQRLLESFGQPPPVLHLASHFVLAPGAATESFLVLGDGGRFSLARAGQLDFSGLDLLVLSACETAMPGGRDAEGREVESFGALAQVQGAGAVLASLWRVADGSTAELMRRFYDGRELGLSKAEALRRAQLAFLAPPPPPAQVAAAPAGDLRGLTDLRPAGTALPGGAARPAISLTPDTAAGPAGVAAAAGQASPPPPAPLPRPPTPLLLGPLRHHGELVVAVPGGSRPHAALPGRVFPN